MEISSHGRPQRFEPCNGEKIRLLRQSRLWTQREFADHSGYSLRLIQKAESGGSLKPETLHVLAKTLSTAEQPVTREHLKATPLLIVQRFIEAINIHEANLVAEMGHLLHDDIEAWCAGEESQMPFAGTWRGIEGFAEYFRRFFEVLTPDPPLMRNMRFATSDEDVVAWGEAHASVEGMPETPVIWVWHRYIIRDGKIAKFSNHFDTQVGSQHLAEARARGLLGSGK